MIRKINLDEDNNKDLAKRIVTRLLKQGEGEIIHVLSILFPNSKIMRVRSSAVDFANNRESSVNEFYGLFESDEVDEDIFKLLSSADKNPEVMMLARSSFEATKYNLSLTCLRTPFKEFFDECKDEVCEQCIEKRIKNFITDNRFSSKPFLCKVEKVENRRLDICKNCGQMLRSKDDINLQNERLLYKCSYCGHKGWTKAK